jgi:hypothetical protein
MLKLPKVIKTAKHVVVGVALAMGIAFTGAPGTELQAATVQVTQSNEMNQGALLLVQSAVGSQEHSYHTSHASHASHASHYSSRR